MANVIYKDCVVDGITIIANTWNVILPNKSITIAPLLLRKVQLPKLLKGCRYLREYVSGWKLHLFSACDVDVSLLLTTIEQLDRIPYSKVIEVVKACMVDAVNASGESATSRRLLHQRHAGEKETFHIIACDYLNVGKHLADKIQVAVPGLIEGVTLVAHFLFQSFGQCVNTQQFIRFMNIVTDWNEAKETCVHFAKDIYKSNKCAFWDRARTVTNFKKEPAYEYVAAGIPGVFNMYFNINLPETGFVLTQLKLYSEIHKHFKNIKSNYGQCIGDFLSKHDGACSYEFSRTSLNQLLKTADAHLETINQNIDMVKRLEKFSYASARAEFVISFDANVIPSWEFSLRFIDSFFQRFQMRNMLVFIAYETVLDHQRSFLIPALNTLKESSGDLIEKLTSESQYIFGLEKRLHVTVSELIIAFMFRGSVTWINKEVYTQIKLSVGELIKELGFTRSNFKLKAVDGFCFGNQKFRTTDSHTIEYCGNMSHTIQRCLLKSTSIRGIDCILSLRDNLGNANALLRSVFACIIKSCAIIFKCRDNVKATCHFAHYFDKKLIIHSAHFLSILFGLGEQSLAGNPVIRNMKTVLGKDIYNLTSFLELLSFEIDKELLSNRCPFLFPLVSLKMLYVVVPTSLNSESVESGRIAYRLAFALNITPSTSVRWSYLDVILRKILKFYKYIKFDYWIKFKNMNRVFKTVVQICQSRQTMKDFNFDDSEVFKLFD